MPSQYSEAERRRTLLTLENIVGTIEQLIEWNECVQSTDDYYCSPDGMKLLAANCTLITAIGEGVNRVCRSMPGFLNEHFPYIPWHSIIGMRNHIAHGYFELDADVVYEAVKNDIPPLLNVITEAISIINTES